MKLSCINSVSFGRELRKNEEAEYSDVLNRAKKKAGNTGKSVLIVPASSLPNETAVGNLGSKKSLDFFDFAKKYWGINEIQILPSGKFHEHNGEFPMYSGSSMELGEQVINIEDYASKSELDEIIDSNKEKGRVNFSNIVNRDSKQEEILRRIYEGKKSDPSFIKFKESIDKRLESKALYNVLKEINGSYDYNYWSEVDKNLYNRDAVSVEDFTKRVAEIKNAKSAEIDFYYFKQFLAEDSLRKSKEKLNHMGLKLNGDMLVGFSYDELWSNPKAFHNNTSIGWGLPALNLDSNEGKQLLRDKVRFYAERYDGLRIDASWTYVNQPQIRNGFKESQYYSDKILKIIDEEIRNVKGKDFDLKSIMHEFATSNDNFNIYQDSKLRPFLEDRMKIYTSDYLSDDWGSNDNFLKRKWNSDSFILGARNHDSSKMEVSESQAKSLGKILKIPYEKLMDVKEFIRAKLAEPMSSKHHMLFFMDALNIDKIGRASCRERV